MNFLYENYVIGIVTKWCSLSECPILNMFFHACDVGKIDAYRCESCNKQFYHQVPPQIVELLQMIIWDHQLNEKELRTSSWISGTFRCGQLPRVAKSRSRSSKTKKHKCAVDFSRISRSHERAHNSHSSVAWAALVDHHVCHSFFSRWSQSLSFSTPKQWEMGKN